MARLFEKLPKHRPLVFGTHSGAFHCDEVVALSMLRMLIPDFELIRSRDDERLCKADLIVDVGGKFDTEIFRFDHHQRGFSEYFSDKYRDITRLSSAGLVYKYFGRDLLESAFDVPSHLTEQAFERIYDKFILSIDAIDNGIDVADTRRYAVNTDLASRVGRMNPAWNESGVDEDVRFKEAMVIATEEIRAQVHGVVGIWLPARVIVEKAYERRFEYHASGRIVRLDQFCPWIEHLTDIQEEELVSIGEKRKEQSQNEVLFGIFADSSGQFRVRAMPKERGSFENKLSFPEHIRGLRDKELSDKSGIPDMVFVHHSGFIAGTQTEEAAIALVELTLASGGLL